ncbi:MAG TPA: hypothetical protein VFK59_10860, partial [Actinomycetota bacterium]|nr:hypothetical protein [Actinomycetota bacterium]
MSEQRRSGGLGSSVFAGVIIGAVETILVVAFAALVFGGYIESYLADGIGLYLGAAVLTLAILAWRAGSRGVVGGLQASVAAVLAVVAASTALDTFGGTSRAFLTVVAVTLVVTVLCGVAFSVLGTLRRGNLIRFVPYPVVGGFLAGTGWLLFKGGVYVASGVLPTLDTFGDLLPWSAVQLWLPAVALGLLLLVATRLIKRPLVIPVVLVIGLVGFVLGMVVTGSSLEAAKAGRWFLGPFDDVRL